MAARLALLAAILLPAAAFAQEDGNRRRVSPEGIEIEVERAGAGAQKAPDAAARPRRIDPSRFRTRVDPEWGRFEPPEALALRLADLGRPDPNERRTAAVAVADEGPDGVRYLLTLLGHGDLRVEDAAEFALAGLPDEAARIVALGLLHPHFRVRSRTARALGRMGDRALEVVPVLAQSLLDENSFVRESAARALPAAGGASAEVVEALALSLGDPDAFVRFRAAEGLGSLGPAASAAVEALAETLRLERDAGSRRAAARALAGIGQPAQDVAIALGRVLGTIDPAVREEVEAALRRHLDAVPDAMPALFPAVDDSPQGRAVREFLRRSTGVDHPSPEAWQAWYRSR